MGVFERMMERSLRPLGAPVERRSQSFAEWANGDISTSTNVTQLTATRIAAVFACRRVLIDAISTLPFHAFVRDGVSRRALEPQPAWLSLPHGVRDPNYNIVTYLAELVASLVDAGEAFVYGLPYADERAQELYVLDPGVVEDVKRDARGTITYKLTLPSGARVEVDGRSIIHITRMRRPGSLRGLSVIDEQRSLLGYAVASQTFARTWYEKGATPSAVMEYPGELTQEQADDFHKRWDDRHAGPDKVSIAVLSGGMTWKGTVPTFEQMQWVEGMRYTAEQIAAVYGVPLHKLNIAVPGAMSYASVEANEQSWVNDTLGPYAETISVAHGRLIPGAPDAYADLSLKGRLRGDTAARASFYSTLWNLGALSPDDIRALEDLPPIDAGDVYRVPLAMGSADATDAIALNERAKAAAALKTVGYPAEEAARIAGLPTLTEVVEPPAPTPPGQPPADDEPADDEQDDEDEPPASPPAQTEDE